MNNYMYTHLSNEQTKIFKLLEKQFSSIVEPLKLNEWFIPTLIDGDVLRRCGYFSTMPNHLTKVGVIKREILNLVSFLNEISNDDIDNSDNIYLTPAACLHFYPVLERNPLQNEVITTLARVYRYEDGNFTHLERHWDFTVREFVAVGSVEYVKEFLSYMEKQIYDYALTLYNHLSIENTNDHFYPTKQNKVKERFQLKNNLKRELVAYIEGRKLAIASFNYHDFHFSKVFNFDCSGTIVTGCVGCGMERWIKMIQTTNSPNLI